MKLKGKGFILRHVKLGDLKDYYETETDKISKKMFMSFPKDISEAKKDIQKHIKDNKKKPITSETFSIIKNRRYVGYVKIQFQNFNPKSDEGRIHVAIHPSFRGKGLATKAIKAITDYGFNKYKFKRIFAQCKYINKAVAKVNRKVGFRLEKIHTVEGIKKMWWVLEKNKSIFPKNKQLFKELIPFAQQIIKILQKNKITPVLYGSFAHFYHTKDKNMKVNDIDILIPNHKKNFPKIVKLLEKEKIKFRYLPFIYRNEISTIIIKKGKLKIEIDETGIDYKTLNEKNLVRATKKIDFYGMKVKIITLKQLEDIYQVAYKRSRDDKAKILKRIKHLERFLRRKLR